MRILHVLDHSIPLHSGYTFRTLAILREQRALGWETLQLTSPKQLGTLASEEEVEGLKFYRSPMVPSSLSRIPVVRELRLMARTARRIEDIVRQRRPDVIHAHSPVLNALPALRIGRRFGIPVVYEVRAFWEDAAVDHGTAREGGLRYRLSRALETYALKRADAVTTICEGLRSEIVARGIDPRKVTVIPNAVDIESFELIVSNPPYVAEDDPHLARGDLRFEPRGALVSGPDGLDAIRLIVRAAPARLARGGWLLLEHGLGQDGQVCALMEQAGLVDLATWPDLAGIARVTGGRAR